MAAPGHCDLHVHSTRSDGTVPPAEVVRLAKEARLEAVALTDHDTFDGWEEARLAGARNGIRVVAGAELSLTFGEGPGEPERGTLHMIALGVDPAHPAIVGLADRLRGGRGPRNEEIVAKLRAMGHDVTLAEVEREAGGRVVARPHVARVLVKKGIAGSLQDAFDRFLAKGRPAYADRDRVTVREAVDATRASGGASVLCHPFTLGYDEKDDDLLLAFLGRCRDDGVDALEVRTGRNTAADDRRWEGIAERVGLLPSGGSDFHGALKPGLRIGSGRGRLRVPTGWLEALLARAASRGEAGA